MKMQNLETQNEKKGVKNMRKYAKSRKGITLIALVITIIVLLILAGISITMLSGDNSVLKRGAEAKETSVDSSVKEEIILAYNGAQTEGYVERWTTQQIANDIEEELKKEDSSAKAKATGTSIKVTYKGYEAVINTSAGSLVSFARKTTSNPNALTVGQAYDDALISIGSKFTYTGNGITDWIVFGKDDEGNVLLTTKNAVTTDPFTLNCDAQHWLSCEDDLNAHCSTAKYGDESKGIRARSITLEDINRVTGYTEPELTNYTFGTEQDYANGKVDYYYPTTETASAETNAYWKKATNASESKTLTQICSNVHEPYSYGSSSVSNGTVDLVFGTLIDENYDENSLYYVVASRAVGVFSSYAGFGVASVYCGGVGSYYCYLCGSGSSGAGSSGDASSVSVRPIVSLPSDLEVQEGTGGIYELSE